MNELATVMVDALCAIATVLLLVAGVNREFRAALRTIMILLVAWDFAF